MVWSRLRVCAWSWFLALLLVLLEAQPFVLDVVFDKHGKHCLVFSPLPGKLSSLSLGITAPARLHYPSPRLQLSPDCTSLNIAQAYRKPDNMEGNVEVIASGVSSPSVPSSTLPLPVSSPGPGAAGFSGGAGDPKTYRRGYPWFDDGNTFLVAEQTSFKVHRGVLAKHSEVFQGLFRIPQPVDAEQHDGIPVINMTDKPGDLAVFLAALYDGPR